METERERLHKDLIKLGDMMGNGLHYEDSSISKEYRRIAKILYPEMYKKQRKPTQRLIRTLTPCICGGKGWKFRFYTTTTVGISCNNCGLDTGECMSNIEARNKWNYINKNK